jgi:hypothetical protein
LEAVRVRYKPLYLRQDEYEITLSEFIRGAIALIVMGIPLSLFVAGLIGKFWSEIRRPVFLIVFGFWTALMIATVVKAKAER